MLAALGVVIPLGLAASVSPVLLTEQTVLLAGPGGQRAGLRFAAGAVLVLLIVVFALMVFGRAISLPTEPRLDASLDLALGLLLLLLAGVVRDVERRRRAKPKESASPHRTQAAFPFGVFAMATNFTTLALMLPASKEISASDVDFPGRAFLALVLVALASIPAWLPVALSLIAPAPVERGLAVIQTQIDRPGRAAVVVLLAAAGLFFTVRGIVRLLG